MNRLSIRLKWTSPRVNAEYHDFLGYLRLYPGIENLILPILVYPGRQITSLCEIVSKRIQGLLEAYFKMN